MAETFNAFQIIGKSLETKKSVLAFPRYPGNKTTFDIKPGVIIGRVYSYVYDKNKTQVWWQFYTDNDEINGKPFYVKHETGAFNAKLVKEQGAKTLKEITDEKKDKQEREDKGVIEYYILKWGPRVAVGAGLLYIGGVVVKSMLSNGKNQ